MADTPAIDAVLAAGMPHEIVRTERAASAEEAASLQGIPLDALLRTIVVRRGEDDYLFVLVPAGRRLDWPKLRAHLGVRRLTLPDAAEARDVTGRDVALPLLFVWTVLTFVVGTTHGWVHVLLAVGVLLLVRWIALKDDPAS